MAISLLACAPSAAEAGFIRIWKISEAAAAPVLVVGRVLAVQRGEPVPNGTLPWTPQTSYMTAEIQVLRSCRNSGEPLALDRIQVHFLAYGPIMTQMVNATPLPNISSGDVLVLPLKENPQPFRDAWNLMADSGMDLVMPVRAEIPLSDPAPASARAFLDREIVNVLSRGSPPEVFGVASYLAQQGEDLVGEFAPLLESAVGDDRRRWAEIATSLLAGQGIPQPSVADLLSGKAQQKEWPGRGSFFLAQFALEKLKASPETDALLIATTIADMSAHAWGSANVLLEFADNPLTMEGVRKALRDDINGSSYVASTLVHNGHWSILPEALARALKVADRPDGDPTDLQGAAAVLRDYGSDQDLKQLAALVRKYQTQDQKFYNILWQYCTEAGNPREALVLAAVLQDRRIDFDDYRYCDYAVGVLARAAKQDFGAGGKTLKERDDAVSRALAWIASQGLPQ